MEQKKLSLQFNWKRIMFAFMVLFFVIGQIISIPSGTLAATKKNDINLTKLTLTAGQSEQLNISGIAANKVKWSSSNKATATVSKTGIVKAKKAGKAVITAKFSGKKRTCTVTVKKASGENTQTSNSKILVAYFSWSGTSEGIAKDIIKQTGADSFRIEREKAYSTDYQTVGMGDAKTEADTNARPAIKNPLSSISGYDKIIICYPIWWHTAPMTVGTFLEKYDWSDKTIYPVSQSASMDEDQYKESVEFIKKNAKNATVDNGLFSTDSKEIKSYVDKIVK